MNRQLLMKNTYNDSIRIKQWMNTDINQLKDNEEDSEDVKYLIKMLDELIKNFVLNHQIIQIKFEIE